MTAGTYGIVFDRIAYKIVKTILRFFLNFERTYSVNYSSFLWSIQIFHAWSALILCSVYYDLNFVILL